MFATIGILYFHRVFSTNMVLLTPIFRIIGGGNRVLVASLNSIVVDTVPPIGVLPETHDPKHSSGDGADDMSVDSSDTNKPFLHILLRRGANNVKKAGRGLMGLPKGAKVTLSIIFVSKFARECSSLCQSPGRSRNLAPEQASGHLKPGNASVGSVTGYGIGQALQGTLASFANPSSTGELFAGAALIELLAGLSGTFAFAGLFDLGLQSRFPRGVGLPYFVAAILYAIAVIESLSL
ncbi:hypothetical protein K4K53_013004 [Colletotrichum sp. SAR 10_77]|nr:hypothetical protein K4K53_013004 [Colletotrichum sp. SAR 10_77]KAJ4997933.1 hypothetical protein K4K48_006176 [Colletotrichum sp. SAR 10_66]